MTIDLDKEKADKIESGILQDSHDQKSKGELAVHGDNEQSE